MLSTNLYTILIPPGQPILSNPEYILLHNVLYLGIKDASKLSANVQDCPSKRYHEFQPFCVEVVKYELVGGFFFVVVVGLTLHIYIVE